MKDNLLEKWCRDLWETSISRRRNQSNPCLYSRRDNGFDDDDDDKISDYKNDYDDNADNNTHGGYDDRWLI